jgi:hypothetical protein
MSKRDKCSLQKMYEKFAMITKHSDAFKVILTNGKHDNPALWLCIGTTPVAMIPHRKEILEHTPDFGTSEIIQELFESALSKDKRQSIEDFDGQGPKGMRELFMESADTIIKVTQL